eukprot:996244-Alexandrium_andersonii.AAC.1
MCIRDSRTPSATRPRARTPPSSRLPDPGLHCSPGLPSRRAFATSPGATSYGASSVRPTASRYT